MGTRTAHCHCGALQALCRGEPIRVSLCHCLACKVRSGSAFSYNATFPADAVTTEGEASAWERTSEEGYRSRGFFCPRCGSTVWFEIERRPGMISLPAGAFADRDFPAPTMEVYGERRHSWLPPLEGIDQE
jgi:hypothetical protein